MALPSSPASTIHHPPRISSCCCCPPSPCPCPVQIQTTSRATPSAAYLLPLRVATASPTAISTRSPGPGRRRLPPLAALPDPQSAAALLVVAAGTVGAASLLLRSTSSSSSAASQQQQQRQDEQEEVEGEECPDCGGTGLCGRCKGEGFVFKQLSDETATKARKAAKNMATRYTAGYCTSSSSSSSSISSSNSILASSCISIYILYPSSSPVTKQELDHAWHDACNCNASVAGCRPSGPTATSAPPPAPARPAEAPAESSPHLSPS
jgi:hypothetical protein